ncbi:hypothetical protein CW706_05760 [Candidatus Bathyarchaeota archaeon]|nr:MAG: hypothetical protein CW706_05760 [Candidatus Bathyarchaeota archaeon]
MEMLKISYDDALIPESRILETAERIIPEIEKARSLLSTGYVDNFSFINLPDDKKHLNIVKELVREKLALDPRLLVVVGIGGSNLGTIAVQEAILGRLYNLSDPGIRVLYADTTDPYLIRDIVGIMKTTLENEGNVLLNVISKSGTTTETIANFRILAGMLRKYKRRYEEYIIATSDKGSKLWSLAVREGFTTLEIPAKIVGRYSVFSSVGLFPLGILGVKIESLLEGARKMRDLCLTMDLNKNPAAVIASIQYNHYIEGKNISTLFFFSSDLESLGKWCRQLIAESLGKEFNRSGERVNVGMTPTVSIGSTDLHSIAQLYLGGPYDKLVTFISVEDSAPRLQISKDNEYSYLIPEINGRRLDEILNAILEGAKEAFRRGKRPFIDISLPDKTESSIGQFMHLKMIETVYLGRLLNVNPFDQSAVEKYKKETRRILSRESIKHT